MNRIRYSLLAAAAALTFAAPSLAQGAIRLSGDLADNTTGPLVGGQVYFIDGPATVQPGTVLTIRPGAIVKFGLRVSLFVRGTLECGSRTGAFTTLTSIRDDSIGGDTNGDLGNTVPAARNWFGVAVTSGGSATIENTRVRFGSGVRQSSSNLVLRDVEIRDHDLRGVESSRGCTLEMENVTIEDVTGPAVDAVPMDQIPNLSGIVTQRCEINEVKATADNVISQNVRLDPSNTANQSGVILVVQGVGITVDAGATLTLAAGMIMKCAGIIVTFNGTVNCEGTAADEVVWTDSRDDSIGGDSNNDGNATVPAAGSLRSISFRAGSTASLWTHTRIRFAGRLAGDAVRLTSCDATFEDCVFERCSRDAFFADRNSVPGLLRCTFADNGGLPAVMALPALARSKDNVAMNNANGDYFSLENGAPSTGFGQLTIVDSMYPGPVLVWQSGSVECEVGDNLTFSPGTVLKFVFGSTMVADGGSLNIQGTAAEPVIFVRIQDHEFFGDTSKGNITAGRAGSMHWRSNAAASVCEFLLLRDPNATGARCDSPNLSLRNVRVENSSNRAAFQIRALAGDADNLVAFGCRTGISTNGGSFDVRHATVVGCSRDGFTGTSSWSGTVRNSNVFGNSPNFSRVFSDANVADTNGGFAGLNGNLDVDPLFVDLANGDLRLGLGSPCVDVADVATGNAVPEDFEGFPRPQDGDNNGSFLPDMGAFERSASGLRWAGAPVIGTTPSVRVWGSPSSAVLFVGFLDGQFFLPGIGRVLIGTNTLLALGGIPANGTPIPLGLPNDPNLVGLGLGLQAVTDDGLGARSLTNALKIVIRD